MKNYVQLEIPFETEEWRPVVGYEGLYEISNIGNVKSFVKYKQGKILKPAKDTKGYLFVNLQKHKIVKHCSIHRLVALAFIPNDDPEHKTQCNHRDENKQNNTVWINADGSINLDKTNLEWVTPSENVNYGTRNERASKIMTNGKRSKPVKQMTLDGQIVKIWPSVSEAGRNGYSISTIFGCCIGRKSYKTHAGFIWQYA